MGRLTFRHLGYLLFAAGSVAAVAGSTSLAVRVAAGVVAVAAATGAVWRPAGRPLDAWVLPLVRYRRRRRLGASIDDGAPAPAIAAAAAPLTDAPAGSTAPLLPVPSRPHPSRRVVLAAVVGIVAAFSAVVVDDARQGAPPPLESPAEPLPPPSPSPSSAPQPHYPWPAVRPIPGEVPDAEDVLSWLELLS